MEYIPRAILAPDLAPMVRAYLECAEFAGLDEDGREALDLAVRPHWTDGALDEAASDCASFYADNAADIGDELTQAGHDFYLTRNRHGAGFWDGSFPWPNANRLTAHAHAYGEASVEFDEGAETLHFI